MSTKCDRSRSRANYTRARLSSSLISTDTGVIIIYSVDNVFIVFITRAVP